MVNLLKISSSHNLYKTLKTIKTAVKLVSITIATIEVALELNRVVFSNSAQSSTDFESTQPTIRVGEFIKRRSKRVRRKKRLTAEQEVRSSQHVDNCLASFL
jgi:hypothetical protein